MELRIATLFFVFLFVVFGVDAADCAPQSGSITIKSSQDVSDLAKCPTFTGNIVVAADGPEDVGLDGVITISGNLDVENVGHLKSLSSKTLANLQALTLHNLPLLSKLNLPALKNFSSLDWQNLPALGQCSLPSNHAGDIQTITIQNTSFSSLDWLTWPVASKLNINSNPNLESFSIPYDTINQGSTLNITTNSKLSNFSVSQLQGIYGSLSIMGNGGSKTLSFEKLVTIGGYVEISGQLSNISMPALNKIAGALTVESYDNIQPFCDFLSKQPPSQTQGHYRCTAKKSPDTSSPAANPTSQSTSSISLSPSSSNGHASSSSSMRPGILAAIITITFGISIVLVLIAWFYFQRRSRAKVQEISPGVNDKPELPDNGTKTPKTIIRSVSDTSSNTGNQITPKELDVPQFNFELAGNENMYELESQHGASELDLSRRLGDRNPRSPADRESISSVYSDSPLMLKHPIEMPA